MSATSKSNTVGRDTTVSTSKPSLLTSYSRQDDCVAVWAGFERFPAQSDIDGVERTSYRHSEGQVLSGSLSSETSFSVDDLGSNVSNRRIQLYERLWRIDNGLDVDPGEQGLFGAEVGHYADSAINIESTSYDMFKHGRADACVQHIGLPQTVRQRVLYLINNRSLRRFNRLGGLEGAIVGYSIKALAEHENVYDVRNIDETLLKQSRRLADQLGIAGTTGRQFRQLIDYIQEQHEGES